MNINDRKTRNNQVTVLLEIDKNNSCSKNSISYYNCEYWSITFIVLLKILKTLYCKKVTNSCYSINRITIA